MSDLDIMLKAMDHVALTASYDITGPDLIFKLKREIERLVEIEEARLKYIKDATT